MIALRKKSSASWHQAFLAMLPSIQAHARFCFRDLDAEAREDAVEEVTANALVAFVRLVELNKTDVAYPSALARYGVAQYRAGRRVGTSLNCRDVSSEYGQRKKGFTVERLDRYDHDADLWKEVVVEDRNAGPAEVATTRIDFKAWLRSLPYRTGKIARVLGIGETTKAAAKKFGISPGRISQLRRELMESWEVFQGTTLAVV